MPNIFSSSFFLILNLVKAFLPSPSSYLPLAPLSCWLMAGMTFCIVVVVVVVVATARPLSVLACMQLLGLLFKKKSRACQIRSCSNSSTSIYTAIKASTKPQDERCSIRIHRARYVHVDSTSVHAALFPFLIYRSTFKWYRIDEGVSTSLPICYFVYFYPIYVASSCLAKLYS